MPRELTGSCSCSVMGVCCSPSLLLQVCPLIWPVKSPTTLFYTSGGGCLLRGFACSKVGKVQSDTHPRDVGWSGVQKWIIPQRKQRKDFQLQVETLNALFPPLNTDLVFSDSCLSMVCRIEKLTEKSFTKEQRVALEGTGLNVTVSVSTFYSDCSLLRQRLRGFAEVWSYEVIVFSTRGIILYCD